MKALAWRLTASLVTLVLFVVTSLAIVIGLFVAPLAASWIVVAGASRGSGGSVSPWAFLILFAVCWGTSFILARGLLRVRPVRFVPPSEPLRRKDAPALFALVDDLAQRASTRPPTEIYLGLSAGLAVTETGGFFGWRSRRVLVIGAPLLVSCTVDELRAGLAHELGHFAGGHTRLTAVLAFTENVFRSVWLSLLDVPKHSSGGYIALGLDVGVSLVNSWTSMFLKAYLWETRPSSRRQELAADRLAVSLAGRRATIGLLEKAHVTGPAYSLYLTEQVDVLLERRVAPTDLLAGFERFRARCAERGIEAQISEAVSKEKTDPFDTHPSLSDRREQIEACTDEPPSHEPDERSAHTLLDEAFDLDAWLSDTFAEKVRAKLPNLRRLSWQDYTEKVIPAIIVEDARKLAFCLGHPLKTAPSACHRLRELLAIYEGGQLRDIAYAAEPNLRRLHPYQEPSAVKMVGTVVLTTFFQEALLERGAEIVSILGEPCAVFRFEGETLLPRDVATAAVQTAEGALVMRGWQARLVEDGVSRLEQPISA